MRGRGALDAPAIPCTQNVKSAQRIAEEDQQGAPHDLG